MSRVEELTSLRERVLAAKGADRRLDLAVGLTLNIETSWHGDLNAFVVLSALPVTASIDAALALVDRVLPGWHANLATEWRGTAPTASLVDPEDNRAVEPWNAEHEVHQEEAPTLPLAILAALLSALISQEPS